MLEPTQAVVDVGELAPRGHDHLPGQLVHLVHPLERLSVAQGPGVQVHVLVVVSSLLPGSTTLGCCQPTVAGIG